MKKSILVMELVVALLIASSVYAQSNKQGIKESHFGIHLGNLIDDYHRLHPYIRELGNIYVRNEVWGDLYGWKKVKKGSNHILASKELCEKYCDAKRSSSDPNNPHPKSYYCENGRFYFCRPDSRKGLIKAIPLIADFCENPQDLPFEWFVSVATSRYDKKPPKNFPAGAYPYGNEDTYRGYIEYLVKRLGDKSKYWQIGNENDYSKFWAGTPKEYAKILEVASKVIRDNCKDCKVGISFASPDLKRVKQGKVWFKAMEHVRDAFDFIDAHYYTPRLIEPDALDEWKKACPGKEFISTETGIPDRHLVWKEVIPEVGGTRKKQAQDLIKYNTTLFNAGYNKIFWYFIDHDFVPGAEDPWEHMGLLTEDYKKKPSFDSYKTMIEKVDYFTGIKKLNDGQYVYTFSDKSPVYVLWSDSGIYALPSGLKGTVKITNCLGNKQIKPASKIVLTESPIFVEEVAEQPCLPLSTLTSPGR